MKIPAGAKEVFAELDQWKLNITNLVTCIEKFKLDKYKSDVQRQSRKFIARFKDVFDGIKEHGEKYDFTIIKISVGTESRMLDLDRNKIFNFLMEV
jgi:transcription termination factor NusB